MSRLRPSALFLSVLVLCCWDGAVESSPQQLEVSSMVPCMVAAASYCVCLGVARVTTSLGTSPNQGSDHFQF